jgi:hypothetical protein
MIHGLFIIFIRPEGCYSYWQLSGIGFETSLILARSGFLTYATMRNLGKGATIKSVAAKEGVPIHVVQPHTNKPEECHASLS